MSSNNYHTQEIRIFLSSTFSDMQPEREHLIKKIFPVIKEECSRRGVDFVVLDLRWGITKEDAASGKVMEICLDEIERTKPYFIGLIGDRYGWVPTLEEIKSNSRLLNRYPWIEEDVQQKLSITEIEMRFGALRCPKESNAFFYIKDYEPVFSANRIPTDSLESQHRESLKHDILEAANRGEIKASKYKSIKRLGKVVYSDLMTMIDEKYPAPKVPSHLEVIYGQQQRVLSDLSKIYIKRDDNFSLSLANALINGEILIVNGEKGVGKSATVSNILPMSPAFNIGELGVFEIVHTFIDASVPDKDMALRMLLHSLYKTNAAIIDSSLYDFSSLPDIGAMLEKRSQIYPPVLWIIDGLENFVLEQDTTMTWIEKYRKFFGGVIVITAERALGRGVGDINGSRAVRTHNIFAFTPPEVSMVVKAYLKQNAKGLVFRRMVDIANNELMHNGVLLRLFLDELLQFGLFEKLDEFIDSYLSASGKRHICNLVIDRLEADFGENLIRRILTILNLLSRGVDEEIFIRELSLKVVEWVPVRASLGKFCVFSNGLIKIIDKDFATAVERRYDISEKEDYLNKQVAMNILSKTLNKYKGRERGWLQILCGILVGSGSRFLLSDKNYNVDENLHACLVQLFQICIKSEDYENACSLIKNKYVFILPPKDLRVVYEGLHSLPSHKYNLSRTIRYVDLLVMPDNVIGLVNNIFSDEQKRIMTRRINRSLLPIKLKQRYLDAFGQINPYYNWAVVDLLEENILSTDLGPIALIKNAKNVLIINNTDLLDSIMSKCDTLLGLESLCEMSGYGLNLVGSFAAITKKEFNRAEAYIAALDIEIFNVYVFFCRAKIAFMQYMNSVSYSDKNLNKYVAYDAMDIFNRSWKRNGVDDNTMMFGLWINHLAKSIGLRNFELPKEQIELSDDNLRVLAFGLYFDGVDSADSFLYQLIGRKNVGSWNKYLASYFAGNIHRRKGEKGQTIKCFQESRNYYIQVEKTPERIVFSQLMDLYYDVEDYEKFIESLVEIIGTVEEEENDGEFFSEYLNGLVKVARILAINLPEYENRSNLAFNIYQEAERLKEGSVFSVLIRLYLALIDSEYWLSDGYVYDVIEMFERNNLQRYSLVNDTIFDFLKLTGRVDIAVDLKGKWYGHAHKPSKLEQFEDVYDPEVDIQDGEENEIEDVVEEAMYGDGIHGEVEEMFRKISGANEPESYVIKYLECVKEYAEEMEIHEDRFITKIRTTVYELTPYLKNERVKDLISEILVKLSSMASPIYGSALANIVNIAEMCAFLGLESKEFAATIMSLGPWEGRSEESLRIYYCYFDGQFQPTLEYVRAHAIWQTGNIEEALKILNSIDPDHENLYFAELYARILCDLGRFEEAAEILKKVDENVIINDESSDKYSEPDRFLRMLVYTYSNNFQDAFKLLHDGVLVNRIVVCSPKMDNYYDDGIPLVRPILGEYELADYYFNELFLSFRDTSDNIQVDNEMTVDGEEDNDSDILSTVSDCVRGIFLLKIGHIKEVLSIAESLDSDSIMQISTSLLPPGAFSIVLFYAEYASSLLCKGDFGNARKNLDSGRLLLDRITYGSYWAMSRLDAVEKVYEKLLSSCSK